MTSHKAIAWLVLLAALAAAFKRGRTYRPGKSAAS
jgi:hypothetical protein